MSTKNCNIICWNVRGLNDGAKRATVRNQILSTGATLVCLQETKITAWNQTLLTETVGADMANNVVCLPSIGASGGILIATSERFFRIQQTSLTPNTVTATITMLAENTSREQTFDPRPKWALVLAFFAPGTRDTFSPGWWLQPGLKSLPTATAPDRGGRDL